MRSVTQRLLTNRSRHSCCPWRRWRPFRAFSSACCARNPQLSGQRRNPGWPRAVGRPKSREALDGCLDTWRRETQKHFQCRSVVVDVGLRTAIKVALMHLPCRVFTSSGIRLLIELAPTKHLIPGTLIRTSSNAGSLIEVRCSIRWINVCLDNTLFISAKLSPVSSAFWRCSGHHQQGPAAWLQSIQSWPTITSQFSAKPGAEGSFPSILKQASRRYALDQEGRAQLLSTYKRREKRPVSML